ncbi:MAG: 3-keto-disaccharide hydrolase [Pirellulaceae bacterium]
MMPKLKSRIIGALVAVIPTFISGPVPTLGLATEAVDRIDYRAQGEYEGRVRSFIGYTGRLGMQVIAQGEQKYEAIVFLGGLPANGWNRSTPWRFSGGKTEEGVILDQTNGPGSLVFSDDGNGFWYLRDASKRLAAGLINVTRQSPTLGAQPPEGADILFDGETIRGLLQAKRKDNGTLHVGFLTEKSVEDFDLHLEFRTPFEPEKRGQGRGNSGVYIQRRYEVQILDSFGLEGMINECGALYRQRRPDMNMCLPPMVWQTYDINFTAARFNEAGEKTAPAKITVMLNGRKVHDGVELVNKTGAGQPEGPNPLPILFQDHSNPVEYRNLWIVHR